MTSQKVCIPFFTDNDVDNKVGDFLKDSGHSVVRLREVMLDDSPDPIVAAACREHGMVLITHNIKHFKAIVKEYEITKAQADHLCRIELACRQIDAVARMQAAIGVIESEWIRLGPTKEALRIFLGDGIIRIHR